jgi:hypothetical protein
VPFEHLVPAAQTFPQVPQFVGSKSVPTHTEPHSIDPEPQTQTAFEHTWPNELQERLHSPQCSGWLFRSKQRPPHRLRPGTQDASSSDE